MSDKPIQVTVHQKVSVLEAWLRQVTVFGGIAGLYWVNHNYLGDSTVGYLTAFFFVTLMVGKFAFVNKSWSGMFDDPDKAIEFIRERAGR